MRLLVPAMLCAPLCFGCGHSGTALREGDLLFQDLNTGSVSDAIEKVTAGQSSDNRNFSHCAMVVSVGDSLAVIEAIGTAVQVTPLSEFYARSGDTLACRTDFAGAKSIVAKRLSPKYRKYIPEAVAFALSQIGSAYDDEYILNNSKWYCSELLTEAFNSAARADSLLVFTYSPMTFADPASGKPLQAWVDYYRSLPGNPPIPEGLPGNNPNSLFSSPDSVLQTLR